MGAVVSWDLILIPMRITIKYLELAKRSKVIRFIQFLA